tara:strand:+ start:239 stop:622 length:384 start_codon:yes stop_codon:yes gene_type:complete
MKTFQQFQEQIPKPPIIKNLENLSTEVSKKINPIDLRNLILKNVTDKLITPTANKLNDKIDPNKMNQGLGNALKGFESTFGSGGKAFTDMNKLFTELGIKTNKTSITPKVPKVNTNNNLTNTPGGMK